jgi:hypothetical protein
VEEREGANGLWLGRKKKEKKEREEKKSGPSEGKRGGEAEPMGEMVVGGPVRKSKGRNERKEKNQ